MENIIVIGAGMAGIMAAKTLQENGQNVVILEAKDRIGGRTHTDYSLGNSVDLGASWIHGKDGNPFTPIAKKLNIETAHTDFLNRTITAVKSYTANGTPLDQQEYAEGLWLGLSSFYQADASILYKKPRGAVTLKDWVEHGLPKPDGLTPAQEAGFRYQSLISSEYLCSADWDTIHWDRRGDHANLPGGDQLAFGGGFSTIVNHLADGLDIRTDTQVFQIHTHADHIELWTSAGTLICDRVIVTVPLGVLKSGNIQFQPPLPQPKLDAIHGIGFGDYEKIAMRFDKFYWPKEPQRFNYLSEGETPLFHAWLNIGHYTGDPIIVAYHAGRRARKINEMSDDELLENCVSIMQKMFGNNGFGDIPQPEAYVRTGWQNDPFTQGSYTFDKVGQQPHHRHTLARPVGDRLFFAGEATHPRFYSTAHGAYETGIRAAQEIAQAQRKSEISYTIISTDLCKRVAELVAICFPTMPVEDQYTEEDLQEMVELFPEGTIVAMHGDKAVGMGTGILCDVDFDNLPDKEHWILYTPDEVAKHNTNGDYYYGSDICVHPDYRGRGIAKELYKRRKAIVTDGNKLGFVAAAVLPGYLHHKATMDIHTYVNKVVAGELFDPTLSVQLRNGFRVIRPLHKFFSFPKSDDWSALILWENPQL